MSLSNNREMIEEIIFPPLPVLRHHHLAGEDPKAWENFDWYWEEVEHGKYPHAVYVMRDEYGSIKYVGSGGAHRPLRRPFHLAVTQIVALAVGQAYARALERAIYDELKPPMNHARPLGGKFDHVEKAASQFWARYRDEII